MPSTDIDGSVIVILNREEAEYVRTTLLKLAAMRERNLPPLDKQIVNKIACDLNLPRLEPANGECRPAP
jgi:hypothetical protein